MAFKRFDKTKHIKTRLRVGKLLEEESRKAYKGAIQREESVLFDETDSQFEEEKITYVNSQK